MAGESGRCKRCGRVYRTEGVCHECWNPVEGLANTEPVVVLPVAEYERLRGIEARLRDDELRRRYCDPGEWDEMDTIETIHFDGYLRAVLGEEKP